MKTLDAINSSVVRRRTLGMVGLAGSREPRAESREPRAELRFLQTPSGSNLRRAVPRGEIIYLLRSGGRVDAPLRDRVHLSAELSTDGVLSVDFLDERPGRLDGEHRVSTL